ncbi:MAG: hypothetical protein IKN43_00090 [Selenomonadaceae bacterium]|nr:hypothetical protein [Selenomonadaceae bacterium]
MCVDKYAYDMSDERFAYVYTLIELVKRGYRRVDARKMIESSTLMGRLQLDSTFFFHYDETTWADWVIADWQRQQPKKDYTPPKKAA